MNHPNTGYEYKYCAGAGTYPVKTIKGFLHRIAYDGVAGTIDVYDSPGGLTNQVAKINMANNAPMSIELNIKMKFGITIVTSAGNVTVAHL